MTHKQKSKISFFIITFLLINLTTSQNDDNTISVIGIAKISLQPDIAIFSLSISSVDANSKAAAIKNSNKLTQILNILTMGNKIPLNDIQKYQMTMAPQIQVNSAGQPQIIGQSAAQSIKITLRKDWKSSNLINVIIDQVNKIQGIQVSDISFDFSNKNTAMKYIRKMAFNDAKNKAMELVSYSGRKLDVVLSIIDGFNAPNNDLGMPQMPQTVQNPFLASGSSIALPKISSIDYSYSMSIKFKIV